MQTKITNEIKAFLNFDIEDTILNKRNVSNIKAADLGKLVKFEKNYSKLKKFDILLKYGII
jgi:hypothetical protein